MAATTDNGNLPANTTVRWDPGFDEYTADSGCREAITKAMSALDWHRTLPETANTDLRERISYLRDQPLAFGLSKTFRPRKPKALRRYLWSEHEYNDTCALAAQVDLYESPIHIGVYVTYHLTYGRAYTQIAHARWTVPEPAQPTCAYCLAGLHDLCTDRVPGLIGVPARRRSVPTRP